MKRIFSFLAIILLASSLMGQAPESFKYQSVLRNLRGDIKINTATTINIDIVQGSTTGKTIYSETHHVTTDSYGLINLEIGNGESVRGNLSAVDWSKGSYYIRITVDGVIMGTGQLLSVPYALHAKTAEKVSGAIIEIDSVFRASPAYTISSINISNWTSAYGWGNHAGLYRPISWVPAWKDITSKPTTIAGYGITDSFSGNYDSLTNKPTGKKAGDMQYWNGSAWVILPVGKTGQVLTLNSSVLPVWQDIPIQLNPIAPTVMSLAATNVLMNTATFNGSVNANGFSSIVWFEFGTSTQYGTFIEATQSPVTGASTTNVNQTASGLIANTNYHYRLKASNAIGLTYGGDLSFTTPAINSAILTTVAISAVTSTSATSGGNISSDGGFAITARGVCWSTAQNPTTSNSKTTDGTGKGTYTSKLSGLKADTTYYIRAYATNSAGTTYGNQITAKTIAIAATLPVLTTTIISAITALSAKSGGTITSNGGTSIMACGVCWSTTQNPTITNDTTLNNLETGSFISYIDQLSPASTYYVRAYAKNSAGTAYGNEVTATTSTNITAIGATYAGGLVFYIDGTGQHGLVSALINQNPVNGAIWGCEGITISGADGTTVGTGKQNTNDIINGCITSGIAARLCRNYNGGGYSDWFLPSKDELGLMFTELKSKGIGNFDDTTYWSSSEENSSYAHDMYFPYGGPKYHPKNTNYSVRAARTF